MKMQVSTDSSYLSINWSEDVLSKYYTEHALWVDERVKTHALRKTENGKNDEKLSNKS